MKSCVWCFCWSLEAVSDDREAFGKAALYWLSGVCRVSERFLIELTISPVVSKHSMWGAFLKASIYISIYYYYPAKSLQLSCHRYFFYFSILSIYSCFFRFRLQLFSVQFVNTNKASVSFGCYSSRLPTILLNWLCLIFLIPYKSDLSFFPS